MLPMRAVLISGLMIGAASVHAAAPGSNLGSAAGSDAGSALVSVYALSFHPEVSKPQSPGTTYVCRARVMPDVSGAQPAARLAAGNQSGCALEVPLVWAANRPQPVATMSYEVDEIGADGRVLRRVAREGITLPQTSAGSVSRVTLTF